MVTPLRDDERVDYTAWQCHIDDLIDYTVARMLDQFAIEIPGVPRWSGEMKS